MADMHSRRDSSWQVNTPTNIEANASEVLEQVLAESEDDIAALKQQNFVLKQHCKVLRDERDAAIIDYAVAEGKLMSLESENTCQNCCLKDNKISHLEERVHQAELECTRLNEHIRQLEEQLGSTRLHQSVKKKKRKVSQQQQRHYHYHEGPLVSSPTMESTSLRSPCHMPQAAASRTTVVEEDYAYGLSALKDVLYKNDQLVADLASSFEPTCIQGKPGSWISLCDYLKINPTNLIHVEARSRLLDILKEYEKTSEHDISVRELCAVFEEVRNKNSACRLLKVAQLHVMPDDGYHVRTRHKTPHKVKDLNSEDVSDSDLDSSSSDSVEV